VSVAAYLGLGRKDRPAQGDPPKRAELAGMVANADLSSLPKFKPAVRMQTSAPPPESTP
jgi:hypothetical protein